MIVIRLSRGGSKKSPFYKFVVTNSTSARDGKFIEKLGFFNPIAQGNAQKMSINMERVNYWISKGSQVSDRAQKLIKEFNKNQTAA